MTWRCLQTEPGRYAAPADIDAVDDQWLSAEVPGTAAGAVRDSHGVDAAMAIAYDDFDWWFVTTISGNGAHVIRFEGIATVSDVWLDDEHVLHSESMFSEHLVDALLDGDHRLAIRCSALSPLLKQKRPRPRWLSTLVPNRGLRWFRTTALGRMPGWAGFAAPVGPWREISVEPREPATILNSRIDARVENGVGFVDIDISFGGVPHSATLRVGNVEYQAETEKVNQYESTLGATVRIDDPDLWWPHTHGSQPLYSVSVTVDGVEVALGRVGFRSIDVDRSNDGFELIINEVPIFARGACWVPCDVVSLNVDRDTTYRAIYQVRAAGMNMIRVPGTMVYESQNFWDCCDELGILVWQDAMLTTYDPPTEPEWLDQFADELRSVLIPLAGRPSIAVVSGGSETLQQPTMLGVPLSEMDIPAIEVIAPDVAEQVLPGIPYVASSPSGGAIPISNSAGVAHYFGVGGYMRGLSDARLAQVKFAAECLAFSNPPEPSTVDKYFGGPAAAGQRPDWKAGVPRDAGSSWDFEDVRDFYTTEIFDIEPTLIRVGDPARALDLGRAAVASVMVATMSEWRRPESPCAGALVLSLRDLIPGAGWGLVDSTGVIKSPMAALAPVLAPVAITVCDNGLDGIGISVHNDPAEVLTGDLTIDVFDRAGHIALSVTNPVEIPAHESRTYSLDAVLGMFRDVNYAFRFGPQHYDAIRLTLSGSAAAECVYLIDAPWRAEQRDVGLSAVAEQVSDTEWAVTVSTEETAEWVAFDIPGVDVSQSWFHICAGSSRTVLASGNPKRFAGSVRALNSLTESAIAVK